MGDAIRRTERDAVSPGLKPWRASQFRLPPAQNRLAKILATPQTGFFLRTAVTSIQHPCRSHGRKTNGFLNSIPGTAYNPAGFQRKNRNRNCLPWLKEFMAQYCHPPRNTLQTGNRRKETGRRNPVYSTSSGDCVIWATTQPAIGRGGVRLLASLEREAKSEQRNCDKFG